MQLSRRSVISGLVGCSLCGIHRASATTLPTDIPSLFDSKYQPQDVDEEGMWQSMEQLEDAIQHSDRLLRSAEMQEFTVSVVEGSA